MRPGIGFAGMLPEWIRRRLPGATLVLVVLSAVGCSSQSTEESVVVITAGSSAASTKETTPETQTDVQVQGTIAEVEQVIVAYALCLSEDLDVAVRFRTDIFVGLGYSMSAPNDPSGEKIDFVDRRCKAETGIDAVIGEYQTVSPLSSEEQRRLAEEYVVCASAVSPAVAAKLTTLSITTLDEIEMAPGQIEGSVPEDEWWYAYDCKEQTLFGPWREFPHRGEGSSP